VREYYQPYNPARVHIHYINDTMMQFRQVATDPEDRRVNINSNPDEMYARQYALVVVRWTTLRGSAPVLVKDKSSPTGNRRTTAERETKGQAADLQELRDLHDANIEVTAKQTAGQTALGYNPKLVYLIKISEPTILKVAQEVAKNVQLQSQMVHAEMTSTVIHEIGHAIGISHHGIVDRGVRHCALRYPTKAEVNNPVS
jgi:hypothetical protein